MKNFIAFILVFLFVATGFASTYCKNTALVQSPNQPGYINIDFNANTKRVVFNFGYIFSDGSFDVSHTSMLSLAPDSKQSTNEKLIYDRFVGGALFHDFIQYDSVEVDLDQGGNIVKAFAKVGKAHSEFVSCLTQN